MHARVGKWRGGDAFFQVSHPDSMRDTRARGCKLACPCISILTRSSKLYLRRFHNKRLISVGRRVPRHVQRGIATALIIYHPKTVLHHVCRVRSMNNFQDCWIHYADGLVRECFPRSKSRRASVADAASSCRGAKWPRKLVNCCQLTVGRNQRKRVHFFDGSEGGARSLSGEKKIFCRRHSSVVHVGAHINARDATFGNFADA